VKELVETASGIVRGAHEHGIWAFKGIPYGADTSGEGRFRRALSPQPWRDVRDCFSYGPSCPQTGSEHTPMSAETETRMGVLSYERVTTEDCLVLNAWTPVLDETAKLPVLVWLHGGGWSIGSASSPLYEFSNLSRRGSVVTVGINHRLGILGFLDLSNLGEQFAESGNVGMLDVIAALEWVQANVSGFGGDPANVTIFGESGGGAKVSTLLAMPEGRGLFHKACMMSGVMLKAQTPERAEQKTDSVLEQLGLNTDPEKLQAIEAERLIEAALASYGERNALRPGDAFSPVLGPSLPDHPHELIRTGSAKDVTVVSGCTNDEMISFLYSDPDLWTLTIEDVRARFQSVLGEDAERVIDSYQAADPTQSPSSLLIAIATDVRFRIAHIRIAEAKVEGGGAPTYQYCFAWGRPDPAGTIRSGHGSDMPYFFDNVDKASIAAGPQAEPLTKTMSGALVALARTGDPNHEALPHWPAYGVDQRSTMRFDVTPTVEHDPRSGERASWEGIPLVGISAG
jgi:para-nitrobenzyl esterase